MRCAGVKNRGVVVGGGGWLAEAESGLRFALVLVCALRAIFIYVTAATYKARDLT